MVLLSESLSVLSRGAITEGLGFMHWQIVKVYFSA